MFPLAPAAETAALAVMPPHELFSLIAARRGHFRMESGYHSELWFDLERLFDAPERVRPHVAELARRLSAHRIEAVCGPETGGAHLAAEIGALLGLEWFATRRIVLPETSEFFPVRYELREAQRAAVRDRAVAIVDDAISAGSAVRGTHAELLACGARPVALGALIVFGEAAAPFAARNQMTLSAIAEMPFNLWPPDDCPLCRAGVSIERIA